MVLLCADLTFFMKIREGFMKVTTGGEKISELRKRTRDFLSAKSVVTESLKDDVLQLIYELDTYQIELEVQNEQLRSTQLELEQSQRRYADLYELAPVAYLTLSDKGTILEANLTAADLLGVERAKLINRTFSSFVVSDDQDVFFKSRKRLLETREKQSYELRLRCNNGTQIYTRVETLVESDASDSRGRCRMMLIDITKQKEMECANFTIKERYRAIVMDQNEMICRFDPQRKITFANDAYCRYFDVDFRAVLGTDFLSNIYEEDLLRVQGYFKDLNRIDPNKNMEFRMCPEEGEICWLQWSGQTLFDRKGNIIECQFVGRDITKIKKAERKLQEEVRIRQLFMDALPCVAVLLKYESREIVASNKAAVGVGAVPGRTCYATWAGRTSPCSWCLAPKLWESGEAQNAQFWALGKYWDAYWIPVDEGLYLHYAFDETDKEKNKEALRKARDELEKRVAERTLELEKSHKQLLHSEKLAAVGRLSASLAHEFNNPLQSIMTVIKGIAQFSSFDEGEKQLVNLALEECDRMKNLIANLGDFHRPSNAVLAPVDLHVVVKDILQLRKNEFHKRRIKVVKQFGDAIPHIIAVTDQVKQVFFNLISNGADACENGGIIRITTETAGQNVVIHIQDDGVGMDASVIGHIFEPFFTTKSQSKGTGLGLSVSYGIVKSHGGNITVQSDPGKGSKFSVSFPIENEEYEKEKGTPG